MSRGQRVGSNPHLPPPPHTRSTLTDSSLSHFLQTQAEKHSWDGGEDEGGWWRWWWWGAGLQDVVLCFESCFHSFSQDATPTQVHKQPPPPLFFISTTSTPAFLLPSPALTPLAPLFAQISTTLFPPPHLLGGSSAPHRASYCC